MRQRRGPLKQEHTVRFQTKHVHIAALQQND